MNTKLNPRTKVALYGLLCLMLFPFIFPTWWMVTSSIKPISQIFAFPPEIFPSSIDLSSYKTAFEFQPFARQYFNSVYIAVVVTVVTMLFCSLAGYAFARIKFPGANLMFMVVLMGLLVPSEVTLIPLFQMFRAWGLSNTHWPLLLIQTVGASSVFATFIMRQFFITLPTELEEAARIDGLSRLKIFWTIALPLSKPALAAVAIFTFLHSWNSFLEPLVFISSRELFTLPVALVNFTDAYGGEMWNVQLAASTMSAIPVLIVFVIAQRHFIEGLAHTGLKG